MRHANKINHLGRKTAHRKAMLENMSSSLIISKRIFTTLAKAKVLRVYLEPVITKSKSNDTHNRRMVYSYLGSNSLGKQASKELFDVVSPKVANRPGGYLRIIKTGFRAGDGAEMAMVELVDFNTVYTQSSDAKTATKKKSRRGSKKSESKAVQTEVKAEETASDEASTEETSAE